MWKKSILCLTFLALCILVFVAAKTENDKKDVKLANPKPVKSGEKSGSKKSDDKKSKKAKKAKKADSEENDREEAEHEDKKDDEEHSGEDRKDEEEPHEGDKEDDGHGLLGNPDDDHESDKNEEEKRGDEEKGDKNDGNGEDTFTADDPKPKVTPEGDELPTGENPEHDSLMKAWEEHMSDFRPRDLTTFELTGGDAIDFYDDVGKLPSRIRGAYFVTSNEKSEIDLTITGPDGEQVHENLGKHEGLFDYRPKQVGTYMFTFSNSKYFETKMVTFALNVANSSHLPHNRYHREKLTNTSEIEEKLAKMQSELNNLHVETKFSYKRQESHLETSKQTHSRVLLLGVAESIGILLTACWQIYYIKKLLDNKRIV